MREGRQVSEREETMGQKTSGSLLSMFTHVEIKVALVLLELPKLIKESESCSRFPFSWAVKRKRSSCGLTARQRLVGASSKSPPPLSAPLVYNGVNDAVPSRPSACELERAADKIDSGSPATPLSISFSPSECDENPRRLKRKAWGKKSKEELVKEVQELITDNKRLRTERDQLLGLYARRKEENSALKLMKLELTKGITSREQPLLKEASSSSSLVIKSRAATQIESICMARELHPHQKPFIGDQTASEVATVGKYWSPNGLNVSSLQSSNAGDLGMAGDNAGPSGVPYLNASQGEPESVKVWMQASLLGEQRPSSKFLAAQARQIRMQICRVKNSKASSTKLRYSNR